MKDGYIEVVKVKALMEELKRLKAKNDQLEKQVATFQAKADRLHNIDRTPGSQRRASAQTLLAKVKEDALSGRLKKLGRSHLKREYQIGDKLAAYIQTSLCDLHIAERLPSGRVKLAA